MEKCPQCSEGKLLDQILSPTKLLIRWSTRWNIRRAVSESSESKPLSEQLFQKNYLRKTYESKVQERRWRGIPDLGTHVGMQWEQIPGKQLSIRPGTAVISDQSTNGKTATDHREGRGRCCTTTHLLLPLYLCIFGSFHPKELGYIVFNLFEKERKKTSYTFLQFKLSERVCHLPDILNQLSQWQFSFSSHR